MVSDAEKYKAEDDKQRERVSSKNDLEAYAFQVKSLYVELSVSFCVQIGNCTFEKLSLLVSKLFKFLSTPNKVFSL